MEDGDNLRNCGTNYASMNYRSEGCKIQSNLNNSSNVIRNSTSNHVINQVNHLTNNYPNNSSNNTVYSVNTNIFHINNSLREILARILPGESLDKALYLVSSVLNNNITPNNFRLHLMHLLKNIQLVEMVENTVYPYLSHYSSTITKNGNQYISDTTLSNQAVGISQDMTNQNITSSGPTSYMHNTKKTISRHGGYYNMQAKEDILLQILNHVLKRNVPAIVGVDLTGPSNNYLNIDIPEISNKLSSNNTNDISKWIGKLELYSNNIIIKEYTYKTFKGGGDFFTESYLLLSSTKKMKTTLFSDNAAKTMYQLLSVYVKQFVKSVLYEEELSMMDNTNDNFPGSLDKGKGKGKSLGGNKGFGIDKSMISSPIKPIMITNLWSCLYKSLLYSMQKQYPYCKYKLREIKSHLILSDIGLNNPSYIVIPESLHRHIESLILSNAYNQWEKLSIL
ncbi:uncharacterized protein CMU_020590 [Cryptosporidium muris RN66]|uniref:Uncharacterized protein n=1 Tax=Cryptosporidium muris (strain RN66) TaxID=441375 RepID=B6AJ78_CRYMR|nr:uncharacterized protein CMU_020590 [Cryptosporidium muris RN66]EEA08315.1 hypothetical protein, conserved [Cryptosporidium muris RN66]|eukprot:XP_002142664.1 hypothetical protein [Cryptosporidium muris RN66]